MPIPWKNYVGIRKIDEKSYFLAHNIENYDQLLSKINKGDVVPPHESEVAHLFVRQKVVEKPPDKKEIAEQPPAKEAVKKPASKRAKKPAASKTNQKTDVSNRKPKTRTRKTTTKKSTK